ncbi:MAG TPA: hypothetical protein VFW53_08030 [Gallionella sp.]|nr:hypothetical protein [Gallionella sp.]
MANNDRLVIRTIPSLKKTSLRTAQDHLSLIGGWIPCASEHTGDSLKSFAMIECDGFCKPPVCGAVPLWIFGVREPAMGKRAGLFTCFLLHR